MREERERERERETAVESEEDVSFPKSAKGRVSKEEGLRVKERKEVRGKGGGDESEKRRR